ncbi:MAG TPA: hypothetical protein VEC12_14295 [Bacteroidia bacterium]|nr:hypothetical protein [Bacteroidia bacterium]
MRILLIATLLISIRQSFGQKDIHSHIMIGVVSNKYFTTELKVRRLIVPKGSYLFSAQPNDTNYSKKNSLGFLVDGGFENNYSRNNFLYAGKFGVKTFFVNRWPLVNAGPELLVYSNYFSDEIRTIIRLRAGLTIFSFLDLDYQYNIFSYGQLPTSNFTRHSVNLCISLNAVWEIRVGP